MAVEAIRKTAAEPELLDTIVVESKLIEEDVIDLRKKGMWEKVYKQLV
jgi:hypothetical protein